MKTSLFIIKTGEDYIRVREGEYLPCRLDKASVFPMDREDEVMRHVAAMETQGFSEPAVFKLILTEEPFKRQTAET